MSRRPGASATWATTPCRRSRARRCRATSRPGGGRTWHAGRTGAGGCRRSSCTSGGRAGPTPASASHTAPSSAPTSTPTARTSPTPWWRPGTLAGAPARAEGLDGLLPPGLRLRRAGARLRWYAGRLHHHRGRRRSWPPLVELLLHGTQSVVPPTVHPDTGQPYHWSTPDTLEDTPLGDLPELPADPVARLDAELGKLGLSRENPNGRARAAGARERAPDGAHDLEKPRFRSMNDRALAALDRWFPALGLPKSRQRGAGRGRRWRPGGRRRADGRSRSAAPICTPRRAGFGTSATASPIPRSTS